MEAEKLEKIESLQKMETGEQEQMLISKVYYCKLPSKLPTYYTLKKPVLDITDDFTDSKNMIET